MTEMTLMHDNDLAAMRRPEADAILASRTTGASLVRVTMARMYGHSRAATHAMWQIVPHVTERETIGIVDVADGTAWDSMVPITDDVLALGLDDEHDPAGNHPSMQGAGVYFDGELIEHRGQTPGKPIAAPPGWRRIGLPTWRGYAQESDPGRYIPVPSALYSGEYQIRPQLRAVGLMTCYGHVGLPRTMLDDAAGHANDARPAWVHPQFEPRHIDGIPIPEPIAGDLAEAAREYLRECIRHIVRGTDIEPRVVQALAQDDRQDLWNILNPRRDDDRTAIYAVTHQIGSLLHDGPRFARRILMGGPTGSGLGSGRDQVIGLELYGLMANALRHVALERTAAARAATFAALEASADGRNIFLGIERVVQPLAHQIIQWIMHRAPSGFEDTVRAILFRDGPIYLDQLADISTDA